MLNVLVQHGRVKRFRKRVVAETLLESVLARIGVMHVHFGHLCFAGNVPSEAVVELADEDDLEDGDRDRWRGAVSLRQGEVSPLSPAQSRTLCI